jgi:hypothetical protein
MKTPRLLYLVHVIVILYLSYFIFASWWMTLYDRQDFNCVDMSYEVAPFFHDLGFDTKIIYGSGDVSLHCWVSINGIYFDATILFFDSESEYPTIDFVDSYPYGHLDEISD